MSRKEVEALCAVQPALRRVFMEMNKAVHRKIKIIEEIIPETSTTESLALIFQNTTLRRKLDLAREEAAFYLEFATLLGGLIVSKTPDKVSQDLSAAKIDEMARRVIACAQSAPTGLIRHESLHKMLTRLETLVIPSSGAAAAAATSPRFIGRPTAAATKPSEPVVPGANVGPK